MPYYTKEEIRKAKEVDLYNYLSQKYPDELIPFSNGTFITREHDSLKISNGMWHWFSRGIGGKSALDYLIKVKGMSFMEAMQEVLGLPKNYKKYNYQPKKKEKVELQLPNKNENCNKVLAYLKSRGIDEEIINECISKEIIYESRDKHNLVFVGFDDNHNPKYASERGTNDSRYMHDCYGSNKAFSFKLIDNNKMNDSIHVFESAIDLLSYATILKRNNIDFHLENLISLAGVYQPAGNIEESKLPIALALFLNNNQNIKNIYLHLDNDQAGRQASLGLKNAIKDKFKVIDNPPKKGKDFNDYLCYLKGIKRKYERRNEYEK